MVIPRDVLATLSKNPDFVTWFRGKWLPPVWYVTAVKVCLRR